MVQPFSHIDEKIELYKINIYIFSFNAAPTSKSCKPLPYDCTSVLASRYYFQHVFCTCEFNEKRWKHQNTKMYKGPSRSIVRIPQNFFIYFTSDWNFLVTWTKLLSQYKRTNMYVFCNYTNMYVFCTFVTIFFYFLLCFIIKTAIESSIDGNFALSSLWKRVNTWSSFTCILFCCTKLSVKMLSELRYQDMISVHCIVNNLLPNVAFSKAILSHENCMSHFMSI